MKHLEIKYSACDTQCKVCKRYFIRDHELNQDFNSIKVSHCNAKTKFKSSRPLFAKA